MIKRFRVSNFRNLVNVEFRPAGLNLLIGPNNVGKTNLCAAMRFLSLTASKSLEMAAKEAVGETWNLFNVYVSEPSLQIELDCSLKVDDQDFSFTYDLELDTTGGPGPIAVNKERLGVTGGKFKNTPVIQNEQGEAWVLDEKRWMEGKGGPSSKTLSPKDRTIVSRVYDPEINRLVNLFKTFLQAWSYFNLNPHSLRSPEVVRDSSGLLWDGRNLSRTFFGIHNENPRLERKIIEAVKLFEPKLDLFSYMSPDPESVYLYMEDENGHRFSSQAISDGTLRFMAIAYLVLAHGQAQFPPETAPLILVEEPENGIYAGHLKPLLERIDPTGKGGQFVFTSQSPYFIDLFDSHLDGLHLFKPGKPSSVLVKPDPEKIGKLLEEMPLGEMHFREMLG